MSQPSIDTAAAAARASRGPAHPLMRFFKRLFFALFFLALAALILFLLSERHARLFKLEVNEAGALVVLRGRTLPAGFAPWTPQDLQLAQTYAPFELDAAARAGIDLTRVYAERDALDRVLFDLHREAIEQRAGSSEARVLEEVVRLLRRAERLPGISDEQKLLLRDLQIRTAYFEGRQRLDEAAALLQKALSKLRLATEGEDSRYASAATDLLLLIQDSAKSLLAVAAEEKPAENGTALRAPQPLPAAPPTLAAQEKPAPAGDVSGEVGPGSAADANKAEDHLRGTEGAEAPAPQPPADAGPAE